jgi:hypothetical protein
MVEQVAESRPSIVSRIANRVSHIRRPEISRPTVKGVVRTGLKLGFTGLLAEAAGCAPATQTPNATGDHTPIPTVTMPGTMPSLESPGYTITPGPTAIPTEKATATPEITPPPDLITLQGFRDSLQAYLNGDTKALDSYKRTVTPAQLQVDFAAAKATAAGTHLNADLLAQCTDANLPLDQREEACASVIVQSTKETQDTGLPVADTYARDGIGYILENVFTDKARLGTLAGLIQGF